MVLPNFRMEGKATLYYFQLQYNTKKNTWRLLEPLGLNN